jgi:hypothetical protein
MHRRCAIVLKKSSGESLFVNADNHLAGSAQAEVLLAENALGFMPSHSISSGLSPRIP